MNSTLHTDQYLIDGLANNNSKVIHEIYSRFGTKMYAWMQQNSGALEEAQDVFQEAIIDIYRKVTDQPFELTCPFDAFLFVVIRNKWFTHLKNKNRMGVTNSDNLEYNITASLEQDAGKIMQYENQHKLLLQKLEELQEGCKELLKLSWGGLGMDDVAAKLKVTYAYVRKKKSLCMAKLIDSIKTSGQFHELNFAS